MDNEKQEAGKNPVKREIRDQHWKQIKKVAKVARAYLKSNDRWELASDECSAEECTKRYAEVQAKYRGLQREVAKLEKMEGAGA